MSKQFIFYFLMLSCIFSGTSKICFSQLLQDKARLLFFDDFKNVTDGTIPPQWIGNVIPSISTFPGSDKKWLKLRSQGVYLPSLNRPLPENFTLEFLYVHEVIGNGNNSTELTFFTKHKQSALDADYPGEQGIKLFLVEGAMSYLMFRKNALNENQAAEKRNLPISLGKILIIKVKVDKTKLTLRINDALVTEIFRDKYHQEPFNQIRFSLWGSAAEPLITDVKISDK